VEVVFLPHQWPEWNDSKIKFEEYKNGTINMRSLLWHFERKTLDWVLELDNDFESKTFPFLVDLVLQFPDLFSNNIYYLLPGKINTIDLSRKQVACILAGGFFWFMG
jgi:hypothetical protein